jgi:mono/diheme cytochrome c family protein
MSRRIRDYINASAPIALGAALLIGMHHAAIAADGAAEGHRLAEAWCKACHAIEPQGAGVSDQAPAFTAIANRRGTTELSLKVFLKTSHQNMPNLVIAPGQADALADYILSLKTN